MLIEQADEENLLQKPLNGYKNDDPMITNPMMYSYDYNTPRGCLWRLGSLFKRK
jgi:hypothetical protein